MSLKLQSLPLTSWGIGQDPLPADIHAPARSQVLQDQQLEAHCHNPIPSSSGELTKKILVSSQFTMFLSPVSMSALQ